MIKLYDALLGDSMPAVVGDQPWAKAMAVAVRNQMRILMDYADRATLYAAIDILPDEILDILAIDLRVPSYSQSYSLAVKRALIRGALTYWSKAGTVAAVEQLCQDIFGDATVYEWFEYGAEAGYFKVTTTNPSITEDNVDEFIAAVESIKRLSAWLETVELLLSTPNMTIYTGFAVMDTSRIDLVQTS